MKRALKIIGWTLFGVVLTVIVVASIAIYVVFTPARLTPIARQVAAKIITCEHEIGEVDLTFFSTFPRFGFRMDGLLLINPMEGTQNDTVVVAENMVAKVDIIEFLKHRNLHLYEAELGNARVNLYIAPDGKTNISGVVAFPSNPTAEAAPKPEPAKPDTSAGFGLPFKDLRIDGMRLHADCITFVDLADSLEASMGPAEMTLEAAGWDHIHIIADAQDVHARVKDDIYADGMHLQMNSPMAVDLANKHFAFGASTADINEFHFRFAGTVDMKDSIGMDMRLQTEEWQLKPLLAIVPARFTASLADMDLDGKMVMDATLSGWLTGTQLPHVMARVVLNEGMAAYKPMPYVFGNLSVEADAALLMNAGEQSTVTVKSLSTETMETAVKAKGTIEDLFGDMLLNLSLVADANIPDFAYFMPENMTVTGHAQGPVKLRIKLNDLTEMRLEKGNIEADLQLTAFHYDMDSIFADMPNARAHIFFPNPRPSYPKVKWARVEMETDKLDVSMAMPLTADIRPSAIQAEIGNMLSNDPVLYAAVGLQTTHPMEVKMDSMEVNMLAPKLKVYAEYNTQDTTVMPVLQAMIDCKRFKGFYTEYKADLTDAQIEASLSNGHRDKSVPLMSVKINTQKAAVEVGTEIAATTAELALDASARYHAEEENLLLQWNPRLKVNLKDGRLSIPERLPEVVRIPHIDFGYSNREMNIVKSRIELGNSDLNISGNVRQIGPWFRHEAILEGELDIVSEHCDANQLLAWFSADSGSEEKPTAEQPKKEVVASVTAPPQPEAPKDSTVTEPFLVPTDVDLALNTHIHEVEIFEQLARDLRGALYVREGKLILDEVGFVCHAAKLQLTAIYRTPRRNHIYVGLDYHMLDVRIDELLAMIPNLNEMVPMLKSFKGNAQFHLAAETYMNSKYEPKMSTLRGAASLSGKNMVVLDGETFTKISKMLMFNKKTENVIDSINAELTVYKNEIDIYPLCVSMDNYMVALGGRHKTDMTFDYDINVLKPIYLGVHVGGNMDDLQIKLTKCKFAQDFRPHWYQKADTQSMELRRMIKASMEKNVRIKSDQQ
jgi:hypothetical protein